MDSRPYTPDDFFACMVLFDSNVPTFIAAEERADFREYLESSYAKERPCLVLTIKGSVIAYGGLIIETEKRQARLAWGWSTGRFTDTGWEAV